MDLGPEHTGLENRTWLPPDLMKSGIYEIKARKEFQMGSFNILHM